MKGKLLSTLLVLCMMLTLLPSVALAEEPAAGTNVAQIVGGNAYATLAQAVEAAEPGDTVALLKDSSQTEKIDISKDLTLDLGGYTLTSAAMDAIVVSPEKIFTLKNGTLNATNDEAVAVVGKKASTITIAKDAVIETKYAGILATYNKADQGHATVNVYGTLKCGQIGIWGQGPENTYNIDGATINSNYFGVYQNGSFGKCTININDSTIVDTLGGGVYISNSKLTSGMQNLTITNSSITGPTAVEVKYTNVKIENSTLIATADPPETTLNNNGTTTTGYAFAATHNGTEKDGVVSPDASKGSIEIISGTFNGLIGIQNPVGDAKNAATITIKSGIFSSDPSGYCVDGKTGLANTDPATSAEYPYAVGEKTKSDVVEAAIGITVVPDLADADIPDEDVNSVKESAAKVTTPELGAAANTEANKIDDAKAEELIAKATDLGEGGVTLYVQTFMDVQPKSLNDKTYVLDITPQYQIIASTATDASAIDLSDKTQSQVVQEAEPLEINYPVTVFIPLPGDFAAEKDEVFVQHKIYEYVATVTNNTAEFTNPHGFSPFTLSTESAAVAEVDEVKYTSFQDAVNAVEEGGTVEVKKDNGSLSATAKKTITVKNGTGAEISVTIDGNTQKIAKDESQLFTYVLPFVDVDKDDYFYDAVMWGVKNGVTNGTSATTFSPDEVCTRAQMVTFLWRSCGSPEPESNKCPFTDVDLNSYYGDAVLWAAENKITLGTSATTFSPNEACTRAHAVTFLWRIGGSPEPESDKCQFTDVDLNSYYGDAVLWVAEQKITLGTTTTTFDPNKSCTRAEMITFIYRADGMPTEETL